MGFARYNCRCGWPFSPVQQQPVSARPSQSHRRKGSFGIFKGAKHKEQDFYFGDDFLLRRHDSHLEIAGGTPVAQYVYDSVEADGFRFPAKRRAYVRGPDLKPIRDLLMVSIDLSNF